MNLTRLIPLLLVSLLLACQKPTDLIVTPPTIPGEPGESGVIYERGTPTGQPVQKVIGPEGGTLTSADGTLAMSIPAGAVAQATGFSMQPVTPTLPGLIGKQSYRLLPEGLTFAKPVTLQYHYQEAELSGTSAQLLFMAYQGSDGIWKALLNTELDEATHTLTVQTTHFSDWGAFAEFYLIAEHELVKPGEWVGLKIMCQYDPLLGPLDADKTEVSLTQSKVLEDPTNIKNWRVIGKGSIYAEASRVKANYAAPMEAIGGQAIVAVDVYNFLPPKLQPRKGATGKAILLTEIYIEGNTFQAILDGVTYDCEATAFIDIQGTRLTADITSPGGIHRPFFIDLADTKLKAGATYPFYDMPLQGKANAVFTEGDSGQGQLAWLAYYDPCGEGDIVYSPGGVHIDSIKDDIASGSLTMQLFHYDHCQLKTRKLSAKFRLKVVEDF